MKFVRPVSDGHGTPWPTPLVVFLTQAAWIPQIAARGGEVTYATAETAWWWNSQDTPPEYLTAVPATLRRRQSTEAPARLRLLGIRAWDDPRTARDRLQHLPDLVKRHAHLRQGVLRYALSREYEKAWLELLPAHDGANAALTSAPDQLVVARAGVLEVCNPEAETVYVPDPLGTQNHYLLERVPALILPISDKALGRRIHAYLGARTGFDVRLASEADTDIQADLLPVAQAARQSLLQYSGSWLRTLVAALVEFDEDRASRPDPVLMPQVVRSLQTCDYTVATRAVVWIAGHSVEESGADRSLLHRAPDRPCLVVLQAGPSRPWRIVRNTATALSMLIGAPYLAKQLRASLIELEERCPQLADVSDEDIAAVLGVPLRRLELVLADRASQRSGSTLLVPLLACVDLDLAEELQRQLERFDDRTELGNWLADKLDPNQADLLMRLIEDDDRQRQLAELSVSLADANRAWQTLGLSIIDNQDRHSQQFEAWLQHNGPALLEQVRNAHAGAHRSGYLHLRSLPGLEPDPKWHTAHWDLSLELLTSHANQWAEAHLPTASRRPPALRPLAEVREAAIGSIHRNLSRLRPLIEEWTEREGITPASPLPSVAEIVHELDGEGMLDFEVPTIHTFIDWFEAHRHWPDGMPASDRRADLGLDQPRRALPAPNPGPDANPGLGSSPITTGPHMLLNGRPWSTRQDDLRAFARAVAADVTTEQLAQPPRPVGALTPLIPQPRTASGSITGTKNGSFRGSSLDQDKTEAIGLAGEMIVGIWLEQQFGLPPQRSLGNPTCDPMCWPEEGETTGWGTTS
ncbi:hypothetical protein [Streptomyces sp. NBC_00151]|uniref:hypothetical protein n=1 Tax=Streptomyces sp. NBC_00151 TaxID=2975669 RepID=UPI002DDC19CF|nr:hypothetical protein [Streptomyces sp. NBC_00151]WRZ44575.1 hypothetical protein OG915_45235 [Streptomyces sp. NBC_00151]